MNEGLGLLATGVFVGLLGVLIRFGGMVELVAGYDPERVEDDEGLARFVGSNVLYVAALTVVVGVVEYVDVVDGVGWHWGAYLVGVFALAARTIRGARRFERPVDA
ncbi:DUF3784 domain-containing protein [Halorubellus sp. PRR65]|uniref:DUF3784 domain-containing protein n=1 Tax=Halorubellus sp. PRR65 TaxID=3098148 RepID=UPI002B25E17B|nr:DUF3784 domain-containing protein [Halorubellus sp. PRR65]